MSTLDRPDSGGASARLRAAIDYAEREFQVFPLWWVRGDGSCACGDKECNNIGKHPIGRLAPRGLYNATDDVEQVERWWSQYPDANIGIRTGDGLVVLDADIKPEADGRVDLQELFRWAGRDASPTAVSRTGSDGEHWLFRYDDQLHVGNRQGLRLSDGQRFGAIDVRGDGGYIVAPPSNHENGTEYRWLREPDEISQIPHKILAEVMRDPVEESQSIQQMQQIAQTVEDSELRKIYDALSHISADCDRDTWIRSVGMPLHDHFGGSEQGFQIWLTWSATAEGMETPSGNPAFAGESHCRKQWRSFKPHRNGRGLQSLFYAARMNGWREPQTSAPILTMQGHTAIPEAGPDDEEIRQAFAKEVREEFPQHMIDSLTGPMRDIHEWALDCSRRPDPVIALGSTLAIVAASIGRRFVGPTDASASTAVAVLAPSGAGKDKALECVKNFLDAVPELGTGLMEDSPFHRVQLDGEVLRHRGQLMLLLDEYGSALKQWLNPESAGNTISAQIRKLVGHGGTVYRLFPGSPENPTVKSLGVDKWNAGVYRPAFSLFGFATPGQFFEGLQAPSLTDGFLGRHLLLATREDRVPKLRRVVHGKTTEAPHAALCWARTMAEVPVPRLTRASLTEGLKVNGKTVEEQIEDLAPADPRTVPFADGAADLFFELSEEVDAIADKELADGSDAASAIYRRVPGQVAALSLLLALGESSNPAKAKIREIDVQRAFDLTRWAAGYVVGRVMDGGSMRLEIEDAYQRLTATITRAGGKPVYRSAIQRKTCYTRHIQQLWRLVEDDPRFVADGKKAALREAPRAQG